jgi:hypothetical protein
MAIQQKGITTYKRDKDKMEISGDSKAVKQPILIDQFFHGMRRIMITIIVLIIVIFLFTRNAGGLDTGILKAIKVVLPFLTLLVALVGGVQILLSG